MFVGLLGTERCGDVECVCVGGAVTEGAVGNGGAGSVGGGVLGLGWELRGRQSRELRASVNGLGSLGTARGEWGHGRTMAD